MLPSTSYNKWPNLSARRFLIIVLALLLLGLVAGAIFLAFHVHSANSVGPFLAPTCGGSCGGGPQYQNVPQLASQVSGTSSITAVALEPKKVFFPENPC